MVCGGLRYFDGPLPNHVFITTAFNSHSEANKTLTDARFSYQYYYLSFDQPEKNGKNNHNRPTNVVRPKPFSAKKVVWTGRTADDGLAPSSYTLIGKYV